MSARTHKCSRHEPVLSVHFPRLARRRVAPPGFSALDCIQAQREHVRRSIVIALQQPADAELRQGLFLENAAALGLFAALAAVVQAQHVADYRADTIRTLNTRAGCARAHDAHLCVRARGREAGSLRSHLRQALRIHCQPGVSGVRSTVCLRSPV